LHWSFSYLYLTNRYESSKTNTMWLPRERWQLHRNFGYYGKKFALNGGGCLLTFLKLNGLSALYALVLFVQAELMVNVYRIERITGLSNENVYKYINLTIILVYVSFSILCYFITKSQLGTRKIKYVISVLWIPYFYIFICTFASLYPITNPGEEPLGGIGLLLIGIAIIFPFYIALINFVATIRTNKVSLPDV
jgi:hypothetical protein